MTYSYITLWDVTDLRFWMVQETTEPYLVFIDGGAGRTATMFDRLPQSTGHLTLPRGERYPRRDIQHRGKLPDRPVDRQQGNRC